MEEFTRQLKDENKKVQAVEGEVSELVIARNQLNLRMTDYEAEGIDMKTKCDELKRTGEFLPSLCDKLYQKNLKLPIKRRNSSAWRRSCARQMKTFAYCRPMSRPSQRH